MASIGLVKPFVAKYAESSGTISYTSGQRFAKAIEHELELQNADPVILYADDGAAESMSGFSSGTLTLTIDNLSIADAALIFGITADTITTPGDGTGIAFDDDTNPPYLGYGIIVPMIKSGTRSYRAIFLPKIKFTLPGESFQTKGETVSFGTSELSATVVRDDSTKHQWRYWAEFATEALAESWIKSKLSIT